MTPRKIITFTKNLASGAYLSPWHNIVRAKIMIIGSLGNIGYGALSFALNYSMAGVDMTNSMIYQMLRMAVMGFAFVPMTFWFLTKYKSPFLLLLIQLLGLGLFYVDVNSGFYNAIAVSLAFSPFLALQQYRFAKNQSRENRGNEVALNSYVISISYSLGLFLGGLLLHHDMMHLATVGGSLCTIIGAFFLYHPLSAKDNAQKVWGLIGRNKPSSRITFFYGLFNPMVDGCMPVWMRVMGISAMGAGINMSLRPLIGFFLTPIVGWLIQKKGFRAAQLGGIGMIMGWSLMAGSHVYPWMLAIGFAILSTGTNLLNPMEVGRWMKRRSSAAVISREVLVASGRIPSYAMGIAVSFLAPLAFPLLGLMISGAFMLGTRPKRRGLGGETREISFTLPK